jgi:hypothetical protein
VGSRRTGAKNRMEGPVIHIKMARISTQVIRIKHFLFVSRCRIGRGREEHRKEQRGDLT